MSGREGRQAWSWDSSSLPWVLRVCTWPSSLVDSKTIQLALAYGSKCTVSNAPSSHVDLTSRHLTIVYQHCILVWQNRIQGTSQMSLCRLHHELPLDFFLLIARLSRH